jgi:hypothetical protein
MMAGLVVGLLVGGSIAAPIDVQADPITAKPKDDLSLIGHPTWGTDALIHSTGTVDKVKAPQHVASKKVQAKQRGSKWAFGAVVAPKAVAAHKVAAKSDVRKMQVNAPTPATHAQFPNDGSLQVTFDNCDPCMETMYEMELDGDIYQDHNGNFRYYGGAKFQTLAECQQFLCTSCNSFSQSDNMAVYNCGSSTPTSSSSHVSK